MRLLSFDIPFSSVIIIVSILVITTLNILKPIDCDNTQTEKPTTNHEAEEIDSTEQQQQFGDPESLKKELKEIAFRHIDTDKDGFISFEELKNYLAVLHEKNTDYNVDKQWSIYEPQIHEVFSWEGYEPEKKEVLTWDHYFNQTYPELVGVDVGIPITREQDTARILNPPNENEKEKDKVEENKVEDDDNDDPHMKMLKLMVRRADARWKLADENGDTLLTKPEFKMLLHPDEGYEELQNLFIREATEDMDLNKDGKICLDEFMKHLQVLANEQERNDQNWLSSQQENFGRFLDKNKDGVLEGDEIREWLVPAKSKKFQIEAKRLLDIGDANEDHKLAMVEMLEHYEQYLGLIPTQYWHKSHEGTKFSESIVENHDEL